MNIEDLERRLQQSEERLEEVLSLVASLIALQRSVAMISWRGLARCPQVGAQVVGRLIAEAARQSATTEGPNNSPVATMLRELVRENRRHLADDVHGTGRTGGD